MAKKSLYKAEVVRRVCPGVSLRMLDYWVIKGIVTPSHFIQCRRRKIFLFDFSAIVQVRIVKSLRDAGVSVKTVSFAIEHIRKRGQKEWHSAWLMTDGREVFEETNVAGVVRALSKKQPGQLAFAAIAIGPARSQVRERLKRFRPEKSAQYRGPFLPWQQKVAIPA